MIKIADTDGSGVVEFQEFMEMICDQVEVKVFTFSKQTLQIGLFSWQGSYYQDCEKLCGFYAKKNSIINLCQSKKLQWERGFKEEPALEEIVWTGEKKLQHEPE